MREFMLRSKAIGMLFHFIFFTQSPHTEIFLNTSLFHPKYNEHPDMGLPTVVDKK
jgi:hypothetical protein